MEKWLIAFGLDENYYIWFSPVRALRCYIVIVALQTAPGKSILADSHHPRICLKGIIDGLSLIHDVYDATSKQLGIVGDGIATGPEWSALLRMRRLCWQANKRNCQRYKQYDEKGETPENGHLLFSLD